MPVLNKHTGCMDMLHRAKGFMMSQWMARKIICGSLASTLENLCASDYDATGEIIPAVLEAGMMLLSVTIYAL